MIRDALAYLLAFALYAAYLFCVYMALALLLFAPTEVRECIPGAAVIFIAIKEIVGHIKAGRRRYEQG